MKKFVLAAIIAASTLSLAGAQPTSMKTPKPPHVPQYIKRVAIKNVKARYRPAFASTCAITTRNFWGQIKASGTGVVLPSGVVITNAHVVDRNSNGKLDKIEKDVKLAFLYGTSRIVRGKVLWIARPKYDLAFIRPEIPVTSKIKLITPRLYRRVAVGEKVFAIGHHQGAMPPHLTQGVVSTHLWEKYHRSTTPIYFGSSGGGLFLQDTGLLIGINSRMRLTTGRSMIWGEYIPATEIYKCLVEHGKLTYLEKRSFF